MKKMFEIYTLPPRATKATRRRVALVHAADEDELRAKLRAKWPFATVVVKRQMIDIDFIVSALFYHEVEVEEEVEESEDWDSLRVVRRWGQIF